ncbi:MAG TPA: efflux RND transporter periplasmic adaptor subunit [Syntrophobacteria bacterium]|nr:efflux RND transporter periplasmic adaptor subunit [Syntrophobacteria bacterium]
MVFLMLMVALAGAAYLLPKVFPDSRLARVLGAKQEAKARDIYYCPMHPDYKSDKPGTCPICNMTLVKLEPQGQPTAHEHPPAAPTPGPTAGRKILYWEDPLNPSNRSDKPGKTPDGFDLVPVYADEGPSSGRKILYWQDAMNPAYKSDKPGKAPDGMDLVPVYADEGASSAGLPPGSVKISAERQQLIGVQYGQVIRQSLARTIRAVGKVTYDETRVTRVQSKVSGWIDKVYVDFTGRLVQRGQPLFTLYSPELVSTQQEFLLASRARDHLVKSPVSEIAANAVSLYDSARERLRLWDITEEQIQELERRGTPAKTMTLYSPTTGFVITRNAFPGQRVTPEAELYTIADLDTIWVLADVYEYEVPLIKLGQAASMTLTYLPGRTYQGRVSYIYPQLDNTTRTLKVRLEFANPGDQLKPDMYANVNLRIDYGEHLAVPQAAVLDSGTEQIVFIARGDGYFEPRKVRLGAKAGNFYIVLDGLKAGERVVTSANFLIDSESQLKSAFTGMAGMNMGNTGQGGGAPSGGAVEAPKPGGEQTQPPNPTQQQTPSAPMPEMPGMDQTTRGQ